MTTFMRLRSNLYRLISPQTGNHCVAFQSTLTQPQINRDSDEYKKDLPDPSIGNPYTKEKRICILCKYGIEVNYKNTRLLSQFVSPYTGKIYDKHITGLCETQHRVVRAEIVKAIRLYLMPSIYRLPKYAKDPRLYDPEKPSRPNPY